MNVLLRRLFRNACRSAWAIALAGALHVAPSAVAQQQPQPKVVVKGLETNRVAANGDCQCRYELTLPAEGYTKLKKAAPDTALLLRKLGMTNQESVVEGLRGDWSDDTNTLKVEFNNRGAARMGKDFTWSLPLMEGVETRLVSFRDGTANLTQEMAIPGVGVATSNIRLTLPKGASDVKISRDQTRLSYKLPEPTDAGTTASADFDVDAKKHVMASLAKVHSNRKFANLWTARSVFKNTGDAVLKDYRVRFRMTEYTPTWSPWTGTPLVVPGQTVVDAYFPVMDLDKVGKLTGQTKTSIEIQWQYMRHDGKRFEDTDTKEITLLSRNQVQYSSMKLEECSDWNDAFDMSPIVMGCFVTHEDPVIQQVAGRICKAIGGNEGYLSDEGALQFMAAAFDFMGANIAYQTSPGSVNDHKLLQHVKYGRDVLRNKAGTCIDLAILYGSLCEAVGLKPVLFNIPGHCFPGVYLPKSGKLITVEATQIGKASFIDAVNYATEQNMKPIQSGKNPATVADIIKLHQAGVHPIDLPVLADDVLEKWGITFDLKGTPLKKGNEERGAKVNPIIGVWKTTYTRGYSTVVQASVVDANGSIAAVAKFNNGNQVVIKGTWTMKGDKLTVKLTDGSVHVGTIEMINKNTFTHTDGDGEVLTYTRVE